METALYGILRRRLPWFLAGAVISCASAAMPSVLYQWSSAWEVFLTINAKLAVPLFPGILAMFPLCAMLFPIAMVLRSELPLNEQRVTVGLFLAGLTAGFLAYFSLLLLTLKST